MDASPPVKAYSRVQHPVPFAIETRPRGTRSITIALLTLFFGCEEPAPEPVSTKPAAATARPAASTLTWQAPETWQLDKRGKSGMFRAKYTVPKQGKAKHDAEMLVQRLGTGTKAKLDAEVTRWLGTFEGPGTEAVQRETTKVGDMEIEIVSLDATYKFPMGPQMKGRPAANVIKDGWAGLAAAVFSPRYGNWFFSMVGPQDTVHEASAGFRKMIASLE